MLGSCTPKGSLGVTVDDYKFEVYERVGNAIFSRFGELIHVYGHAPGSKGGFADREIKLRIKEPSVMFPKIQATRLHKFKGDLWCSGKAERQVAKHLGTDLYDIGVKRIGDRISCYSAIKATRQFMEVVSKVVIIGAPVQGDFNAAILRGDQ
nr:hypothetical protein [Acinetobacter sp. YH12064]